MTCRELQEKLFIADSGAPWAPESTVAEHLARCPGCRKLQADLEASLGIWRRTLATTPAPDAEREWQALRRRIRADGARESESSFGARLAWLTLPAAALAAAFALFVAAPPDATRPAPGEPALVASAESVEAPGDPASTMVFVDDRSGWLIVWANDAAPRRG